MPSLFLNQYLGECNVSNVFTLFGTVSLVVLLLAQQKVSDLTEKLASIMQLDWNTEFISSLIIYEI